MITPSFLRQAGWISSENFVYPIHIIGCGAIGSNVAMSIAKMGALDIHLWDFDLVESHNLPNQAFFPKHVGKNKAEALAELLKEWNPQIEATVHSKRVDPSDREKIEGILVIATDTMSSRYEFISIFEDNIDIEYVIESRIGFDYAEINSIDPFQDSMILDFKNSLRDDSEVPEGPCNLRICSTLVGIVSSYAAHLICAFLVDEEFKKFQKARFSLQSKMIYCDLTKE